MATDTVSKKAQSKLSLSPRDLMIVRLVGLLRFVRAIDLSYRLARPTLVSYYRRLLASLCGPEDSQGGFLYRFAEPSIRKGERAWIYALSAKGAHILAQEGTHLPPYKLRQLSYNYLRHSLQLTSFLCTAHFFVRTNPSYTLSREMLSYELARHPPTVTLQPEEHTTPVAVVPDAFLCFERGGETFPVLFEIDRGTEFQHKFKKNLRNRIVFLRSGAYARYFQTPAVLVAYATTGALPERETRRLTMQQWTLEVIDEMITKEHRQGWRELFRFCSLPDTIYDQTTALFSEPVWHIPGLPDPVAFFDSPTPQLQE